jgi:hypothetical protein
MDFETEIKDLKRRVGDLEGAVNVLSTSSSGLQPELQALRGLTVNGFDKVEDTMSRFVKRLDTMNTQIWSLRDDFPDLVGAALRKSNHSGDEG